LLISLKISKKGFEIEEKNSVNLIKVGKFYRAVLVAPSAPVVRRRLCWTFIVFTVL